MRLSPAEHLYDLRAFWNDVKTKRPRERLKERLAKATWIYGAGSYGQRIFKLLKTAGIPCLGFVDRQANNHSFLQELEIPVRSPDAFSIEEAREHTLVIGLMNPNVSIGVLKDWARNFPFFDVIEP